MTKKKVQLKPCDHRIRITVYLHDEHLERDSPSGMFRRDFKFCPDCGVELESIKVNNCWPESK